MLGTLGTIVFAVVLLVALFFWCCALITHLERNAHRSKILTFLDRPEDNYIQAHIRAYLAKRGRERERRKWIARVREVRS